mgnify:CR=1 FL=1
MDDNDSITYNHSYFSGKGIWGGYGAHHHIIVRNNSVHDTTGSGIRFNDSDHITLEYNEVYNCTWWTSSASSAVVFAETIASSESDNYTDVKMIMRGNLVYNNWNRIPFYVTQLPDNSGNTNPNYGTADYNNILDGQGLYVTRSDDGYVGTFLFENNVCVNNGKNGINFDNSFLSVSCNFSDEYFVVCILDLNSAIDLSKAFICDCILILSEFNFVNFSILPFDVKCSLIGRTLKSPPSKKGMLGSAPNIAGIVLSLTAEYKYDPKSTTSFV